MPFDDFGSDSLIELGGSRSECETRAKGRLNRLVGSVLASLEISPAVSKVGRTAGAKEAGPTK